MCIQGRVRPSCAAVGDEEGSRLQRDGATAASCDSLFWDDYGVKPQVENPSLEEQDIPMVEQGGQVFSQINA